MDRADSGRGRAGGQRVLVVDDDPALRASLRRVLEAHGAEVLEAREGREALDLLARTRVDVAVLDVIMPGMEGLGALRAIRERHPEVRCVVATGSAQAPLYLKVARRLGADGLLLKPCDALGVVRVVLEGCPDPASP